MQALVAETGKVGFELAKFHQPDVVVTDIFMPGVTWDGYETARQLRANSLTCHMPIIAVTAGGGRIDKTQASFDSILIMPYRMEDFRNELLKYM